MNEYESRKTAALMVCHRAGISALLSILLATAIGCGGSNDNDGSAGSGSTVTGGASSGGAGSLVATTGGSSSTSGGAESSGGSAAASATGGAATGGTATGGMATGGTATGGTATGGTATGGTATGGSATGGTATGGTATGGTATGGSATGGSATGGNQATGGASGSTGCSAVCTATADGTEGTFCDPRDGQIYRCVVIGAATWMGQNLNFGTQVTVEATQAAGQKYCYDDEAANCSSLLGALYQWHVAMGLDESCNASECSGSITAEHQGVCPAGWHISTSSEWGDVKDLASAISAANGYDADDTKGEASVFRAASGCDWADNLGGGPGTDDLLFTACAGGGRLTSGDSCFGNTVTDPEYCYGTKFRGFWWTTDESGTSDGRIYDVSDDQSGVARMGLLKIDGASVRCVQNG